MDKKSFHLVADDLKDFVKGLPDIQVSDERLPELRATGVEMIKNFFPQQAQQGKKIQISDEVSIFLYTPKDKSLEKYPVLYYIHGGGYISGMADMNDYLHQKRADSLNVVLVAIEYRLAPEHPFPIPLQDCMLGFEWTYANIEQFNGDKDRITIMGESAGGGLAAALNLYIKDKTAYKPKNQILIYPMLDYKTSQDPENYPNKYVGEYLWTHQTNQYGWQALHGDKEIAKEDIGYFSPSHAADLTGLPNTYIGVGSLDLFLEEDMNYAIGLVRAGVPTTLDVVNGAVHAFDMVSSKTSDQFNERLHTLLKNIL